MNKIKSDKINFNDDDFLVKFDKNPISDDSIDNFENNSINSETFDENFENNNLNLQSLGQNPQNKEISSDFELQMQTQEIIENAQKEADEIIKNAQTQAQNIIENAQKEADETLENSKKEASEILTSSKEELEKIQTEAAKQGYEEGHKDGLEKIQEELEEKIEAFSNFCKTNIEIKEKILKSASKDILDIIINISNKILFKSIDGKTLDKIIKATIQNFEEKEEITIIVSEKYAKLLFALQNKNLEDEQDSKSSNGGFDFENFKQYDNFKLVYNPKYEDDTIIVENLKERFDASIKSQLDAIIRDIFEKTKNAQFELDEYIDSSAEIENSCDKNEEE